MNVDKIATDVVSKLLPELQSILDSYRTFDNFFKNLSKIILLDECDIESLDMPNTASDDGIYHNQKILQFIYKNRSINFDLTDGGILSDNFSILPNTGVKNILFSLEDISNVSYSEEELLGKFNLFVDYSSKFKPLKYTFGHLDADSFKELLQKDYDVVFTNDLVYIINDNCRFFINADFESKDIELTGDVSFYRDDEWQEPINLEEELNKAREDIQK